MPTERIRVLLVHDHAMIRQGLRKYLNHCADMELVGEATDGEEAARGEMLWARGMLSKPWPAESLAKYGNPLTAAGLSGQSVPGRD